MLAEGGPHVAALGTWQQSLTHLGVECDQNRWMTSALKLLQIVRVAMLLSVILYVVVGELVAHPPSRPPDRMLFFALTFLAVAMVTGITVVRKLFIAPAAASLQMSDSDSDMLRRWRTGYIISFAIAECIAAYGVVLRLLGFTLSQVAPFYVATVILLLMLSPRHPSNELT